MEKALTDESSSASLTASLADFYQLKYATANPKLRRIDSTVRQSTLVTSNPLKKERVEMLAKLHASADYESPIETGRKISQTGSGELPCTEECDEEHVPPVGPQEEYTLMDYPEKKKGEIVESDEDGYMRMYKTPGSFDALSNAPESGEAGGGGSGEGKGEGGEGGGGGEEGGGGVNDLYYDECSFDSPRYVPKERSSSNRSHSSSHSQISSKSQTSLSSIGEVSGHHSSISSLEKSADHLESISDFLGPYRGKSSSNNSSGSQEDYLAVLPEEPKPSTSPQPTPPPPVPPRMIHPPVSSNG